MTFVELKEKWSQIRVEGEAEKIYELLSSSDDGQVRSTFDLLVSLDASGLCEVLHEVEGQLRVREDMVAHHRLLWEKCIFEEVILESSVWHGLYVEDRFRSLEVRVLGNVAWEELSKSQQEKVVLESLRSVEVPAGTFMMGALPDDEEAEDSERPRHEVTLTKSMSVGIYACTQGLYASVMGQNPSSFVGSMIPVDKVSWCSAILFCNRLSVQEGYEPVYEYPIPFSETETWSEKVQWNREANGYRLLTEAEWEYCARGGEEHLYAGSDNIEEVAWYWDNAGRKMHVVGEKKANGYGLYDMSGNIEEWVWDLHVNERIRTPRSDRVQRGGGWHCRAKDTRVSYHSWGGAVRWRSGPGFRFLRNLP